MILPDGITLPGIGIGFIVHLWLGDQSLGKNAVDSLLGGLGGGGILLVMGLLYEKLRHQEGMGGGDVKLAAMIGAFLGWKLTLFVIFVSSFLGVVGGLIVIGLGGQGKAGATRIPYGPFLAAAAILALFYGETLIGAYLDWTQRFY